MDKATAKDTLRETDRQREGGREVERETELNSCEGMCLPYRVIVRRIDGMLCECCRMPFAMMMDTL